MSAATPAESSGRRARLAGLLLSAVSVALTLPLGEGLARLFLDPGDFLPVTRVADPALGYRVPANTAGHDALGYRNAAVPERAAVVALGDSMTYGFGVPRHASWPQQLAGLLGEPVYNMGQGGYGPLQYLYLLEHEVGRLRPRTVAVGLYLGNDLIDAYAVAYGKPYWGAWRTDGISSSDASEYHRALADEPTRRFAALREFLSANSVLYGLVRATVLAPYTAWHEEREARQGSPERRFVWVDSRDGAIRTIFQPQLRLAALDPALPSVREGIRITRRALTEMRAWTAARGIGLLVVLIPTKEGAYCGVLRDSGSGLPGTLDRLCAAETALRREWVAFLAAERIAHVDVAPVWELAVRERVRLFPQTIDGHPLQSGHARIAHAVHGALRADGAGR